MSYRLPEGEYCAYLRKSRADMEAENRGEEETYAKHEKILSDLAGRLRVPIAEIYRERPVSGERIAERPEMLRLLEDVEQGVWKGVLVVEVERLARGDTMDQGIVAQAFKYSDTLIVTPMRTFSPKDPNDEEYFEFNLFMSRREFKTITRRLQGGRAGSVKEGKYVGNIPPYGYVRVKLERSGYSLQPHPEQAPVVKLIFALYTHPDARERMGAQRIAMHLNELNIPTMKNKRWAVATVNGILRNPTYAGMVRWKSRPLVKKRHGTSRPRMKPEQTVIENGLHEPIIDPQTFQLAQQMMRVNSHPPTPGGRTIANPLAGLVRCGVCGAACIMKPQKKVPASLLCSTPRCANKSSYLHLVEERLLQALAMLLEKHKDRWNRPPAQIAERSLKLEALKEACVVLEKKIGELERQLGKLDDLLEQGVYTAQKYQERANILEIRISEARKSLQTIRKDIRQEEEHNAVGDRIIPRLGEAFAMYGDIEDAARKNVLLRTVVESVVYTKEEGGRWHGAPDRFTLHITPKIPE